MIDFHHVDSRHDAINLRLEQWAKWVAVHPKLWGTQPMFRGYQSKARQWETCPVIQEPINTLEAAETERAVSGLPDKNRDAIRWSYVFWWIPARIIQRELCVNSNGLCEVIVQSREMLKNRLK